MDLAYFHVRPDGTVNQAYGSALATMGIRPENIIGQSLEESFEGWPDVQQGVREAIAGQPGTSRIRLDGHLLDVAYTPENPERSASGVAVVGFDRRHTPSVASLRAGRRKMLSFYLKQVPGVLWMTDTELRLTHVYGRVVSEWGLIAEDQRGRSVHDFLGTDDPDDPAVAGHVRALEGEKAGFFYQYRGSCFQVALEPLLNDAGEILGVIGAAVDVTDVMAQAERLRQSEARLAEAQRLAHVGSFTWYLDTDRVEWSDEMYRIYSVDRSGFPGTMEGFWERIHPEDITHIQTVIEESIRDGTSLCYQHRIVRDDGETRILHTQGEVVRDAKGRPLRVAGSCWDISEQHQAKTDLERAVSLLEATLNATAEGVLVVGMDGRIITWNQVFLKMWAVPPEYIRARDDHTVLAYVLEQVESPDGFLSEIKKLYDNPEEEQFDVIHFKDGRVFERYSVPQRIGDDVVGRVWSFRDVTRRETLLRRRTFLLEASRLLSSLDAERGAQGVAQLAVPLLGESCRIAKLEDGHFHTLARVGPHSFEGFRVPDKVMEGHPTVYQIGTRFCLSLPVMAKGKVLGVYTFRSGRHRRYGAVEQQMGEELAGMTALSWDNTRLYEEARKALGVRDEFLSIIAHEIRSPIMSLNLAVESLQQARMGPEQQARVYSIIEGETKRMTRFVDDLLNLGKIRSGQFTFHPQEADLCKIIRDVVSSVKPELERSGSRLEIQSEALVPGYWDAFRMEQVVRNLLTNAIKFGLGKPITISVRQKDDVVELKVRDQGIGIPPELTEQIFNPFERAVGVRHFGGLGLGLYIVRAIVEAMGGHVKAESEPEAGTTVTVCIPVKGAHHGIDKTDTYH